MATKPAFASLYGEGAEEQQLVDEIKGSYAKLRQALDEREKGPLFDPVLIAMAQGFLAPTKTGGFGESLGNVAALVGPAQAAQEKQARENAMMRMELAQQQLGQLQASRGEQAFKQLLGRMQPETPTAPTAPSAATGAAGAETQPLTGVPAGARRVTPTDIAALAAMPGMEQKAKILQDALKAEQDRYVISMQGIVFDRATGRYLDLDIPGQKQEEFTTPYGTERMTPNEYARFSAAQAQGNGKEWMDRFKAGEGGNRPSVAEIEASKRAAEEKAKITASEEAKRTQAAIGKAEDVTSRMGTYNVLERLASKPGANQVFGIFAQPDIKSGILKLVETGIGVTGYTIGIPEIQNVLRNVNLPPALISDAQLAASLIAEAQLQTARLGQGQGSVSNFERQLFGQAALTMDDRPETILRKVNMLRARAELDRDVANALKQSKMDVDDFKSTKRYQDMVADYLEKLGKVAVGGTSGWRVNR